MSRNKKKPWSLKGEILEMVQSSDLQSRSFAIKLDSGKIIWISSKFIRLDLTKIEESDKDDTTHEIYEHLKIIMSW